MQEITGDIRKRGIKGVIGARWLLGTQRRAGKAASSVFIFLDRIVSFHVQDGQSRMKIRGRCIQSEYMILTEDGADQGCRVGGWVFHRFFFTLAGFLPVVPWVPNRQRGGNGPAA